MTKTVASCGWSDSFYLPLPSPGPDQHQTDSGSGSSRWQGRWWMAASLCGGLWHRELPLRSQQKWMNKLKGSGWNVLVAQTSLLLMKQQENLHMLKKKRGAHQDFPGGTGAKTLCFQRRGPSLIPGQGTRSHIHQLKKKNPTGHN